MTESYTSTITALREELAGTQKENEELRRENGKQRETINRANARMAALTEENEELRKERDDYKQQLEEANEQHAAELREVTEEMAAAARFSDKEWQEHCDRVEAQCGRLQRAVDACMPTVLEYLPHAETAARQELWEAEAQGRPPAPPLLLYHNAVAAARAVAAGGSAEVIKAHTEKQLVCLCRALGYTREELYGRFLGMNKAVAPDDHYDTSAQARGLWELYRTLSEIGFPSDAVVAKLLEGEKQVRVLYFNAVGHEPDCGKYNYAIPPAAAYDFFHRLLRHLPRLEGLYLSHLPPLSSPGALEGLAAMSPTLGYFHLYHTDYTVSGLLALHERCPRLMNITVHASHCTDWGEYAAIADMEERKQRVYEACGRIILWR